MADDLGGVVCGGRRKMRGRQRRQWNENEVSGELQCAVAASSAEPTPASMLPVSKAPRISPNVGESIMNILMSSYVENMQTEHHDMMSYLLKRFSFYYLKGWHVPVNTTFVIATKERKNLSTRQISDLILVNMNLCLSLYRMSKVVGSVVQRSLSGKYP
jgi:hypothetical protein